MVIIFFLGLFLCNAIIDSNAEGKTYSNLEEIPQNRVGLVLGTSKRIRSGHPNPYYSFRIEAVVKLYEAGKIDYVLVSGDNGSIYYNEPNTIKKDLMQYGIPKEKIYLDYAGFRTLDSMVRAKEIFGLNQVTIISQKFHNERAIYLAETKGLKAIGFNATDISGSEGYKVQLREYFARVKVFLDLLMNTQPRFYGEKVEIK
ncbi:SanA protein [Kriegella aquimaris]|uniref:SanA protein n=2 Tax=Kriegella aquimaris TaxID=192904 RepID=A0A1G9TLB2_9FLAO|nr:SanA protein [Kriegella aquimaris]